MGELVPALLMLPVAEDLYRTGHADEALQMLRDA